MRTLNTYPLIRWIRVDPQETRSKDAVLDLSNGPRMVVQTEDGARVIATDSWSHVGLGVVDVGMMESPLVHSDSSYPFPP